MPVYTVSKFLGSLRILVGRARATGWPPTFSITVSGRIWPFMAKVASVRAIWAGVTSSASWPMAKLNACPGW